MAALVSTSRPPRRLKGDADAAHASAWYSSERLMRFLEEMQVAEEVRELERARVAVVVLLPA